MRVAGVDFSTHAIDVVTVPYEGAGAPVWHRFPLTGSDAFDRARSVADAMPGRSSVFWDDVLAVGIEHPAGRHGVAALMRVQGAVLSCLPARMLVTPWPPAKWRALNGLKGNACKKDCADHAIANGAPAHWPTSDPYDAYLIACATRELLTRTSERAVA